jgi:hypothetical protein
MNKHLNSFDAVAKCYAEITPIRGKRASEDIRPIGNRKYTWNRIIKLDENTYVLNDGYWSGTYYGQTLHIKTAPIVWERRADGDYVKFHTHLNGNIGVSRYWFLRNYIPDGFEFDWSHNGKHFIVYEGKEYYLPKSKATVDFVNKAVEFTNYCNLTFKCGTDGKFTRVGDKNLCPTIRLDKDLTKKYRPLIKEFWEYMQIMLPIFGQTLSQYQTRETYAKMLDDANNYWYWTKRVEGGLVRNILEDADHENRIALAVLCACEIDATENGRFYPSEKGLSKLNALFNRIGQFYKKEEM